MGTHPSSDGLLAEISRIYSAVRHIPGALCRASHYNSHHYATDMTDLTFVASGHWLGTRIGAGRTATLT